MKHVFCHRSASRVLLFVGMCLCSACCVRAQPVTTILTHGYSLDGVKGPWVESMADAILARANAGGGAVLRYRQDSGAWQVVSGVPDQSMPAVLIYRWLDDFDKEGVNDGFAEAAGDALAAALRDPRFVDQSNQPMAAFDLIEGRALHFISHSRGTCVNSEAVERFAIANIPVDQVTTFDPHPMNGTLDPPINFDWGDPVPAKWSNVDFADNYWRADGGWANAADFDGMPLPNTLDVQLSEAALECCAYTYSHSDTHLWYHATIDLAPNPCDGEQCISDTANDQWYGSTWPRETSGYYFSILGGGSLDRPAQPQGDPPGNVETIFNGSFDNLRHAGWVYHGGHLNAAIVEEGGEQYLRMSASDGVSAAHNRFYLERGAAQLQFDYRVLQADAGDRVRFELIDADDVSHLVGEVSAEQSGDWIRGQALSLPSSVAAGARYRLSISLVDANGVGAVVGVDSLSIVGSEPAELVSFDVHVGTLVAGTVDDLRASDDLRVHTRSGFGQTFTDLHNMTMNIGATTSVQGASTITLSVETRLSHPSGIMQLRLRNWNNGEMVLLGTRAVNDSEDIYTIEDIDASNYIEPGTGNIELQVKQVVFVPQFAFVFDSWVDWVEISVR